MRNLAFIAIVVLGFLYMAVSANDEGPAQKPEPAKTVLEKAKKQAAMEHKNILVIFHASWCGWCKRFDAFLTHPDFKKMFTDSLVIVHLDTAEATDKKYLENPGADKTMIELGGKKAGYPFFAVVDSTGKKLADSKAPPKNQNIGCPATPEEIEYFLSVLQKTAPKITEADREKIKEYLTAANKGGG